MSTPVEETSRDFQVAENLRLSPSARLSVGASDPELWGDSNADSHPILTTQPFRLSFEDHDRIDEAFVTNSALLSLRGVHEDPGLGLRSELGIVLRGGSTASGSYNLVDASSFLNVSLPVNTDRVLLTVFPLRGDPIRLGHSRKIGWGMVPAGRPSYAPAAALTYWTPTWSGSMAVKYNSALVSQPDGTYSAGSAHALLVGISAQLPSRLRLDLQGVFSNRGTLDLAAAPAEDWNAFGGSLRLIFDGAPAPQAASLYEPLVNDPIREDSLLSPKTPSGVRVESEVTLLFQRLLNGEENVLGYEPAYAADLQGHMTHGRWRFSALGYVRNAAFITFDVPSIIPFHMIHPTSETKPETGVSVTGGFSPLDSFETAFTGGIRKPCTVDVPSIGGTVVLNDALNAVLLPEHEDAELLLEAKLAARFRPSAYFAAALEGFWVFDPNTALITQDEVGAISHDRQRKHRVGFNLVLRAGL